MDCLYLQINLSVHKNISLELLLFLRNYQSLIGKVAIPDQVSKIVALLFMIFSFQKKKTSFSILLPFQIE